MLRSIYSQNLYEQMKSIENYEKTYHKLPQITVAELRKIMKVEGKKAYETFNHFKTKCLNKAINDINSYTDLNIEMIPIKQGKSVVACQFKIRKKVSENIKNTIDIEEKEINESSNSVIDEELSNLLVQLHNGEL